MKKILASNSPRRKELLEKFGYKFEVIKSDYNEESTPNLPSKLKVKYLAYKKAEAVYLSQNVNEKVLVLGADTIVVYKNKILGKPKDKEDAIKTLKLLSGNKHYVFTGYAIITNKKIIIKHKKTKVYFNHLSDKQIEEYVETGLPLDKAGSYGIQDGFNLVKKFIGSFNNVVGLPIEDIDIILKKEFKKSE